LAVNPATNTLFIARNGALLMVDLVTNAVATVPIGFGPHIGVNPVTNKVYVANNLNKSVSVVDVGLLTVTNVAVPDWPVELSRQSGHLQRSTS
jgi:DNA-binding beta-propeller fold protein YncE